MIKSKRLENLKLLKQKKLNKLTIEINTLNYEIKKSDTLKNKLGQIISQKKLIEEKLKFSFLEELKGKEEKLLRATPTFRKV